MILPEDTGLKFLLTKLDVLIKAGFKRRKFIITEYEICLNYNNIFSDTGIGVHFTYRGDRYCLFLCVNDIEWNLYKSAASINSWHRMVHAASINSWHRVVHVEGMLRSYDSFNKIYDDAFTLVRDIMIYEEARSKG